MSSILKKKSNKCRRPLDTPMRQQRLNAWNPVLSSFNLSSTLYLLSLICIPVGVVYTIESNSVVEQSLDYTDCDSVESPGTTCADIRADTSRMAEPCTCRLTVAVTAPLAGDVTFYYALENFFQNHRRYVKSRDDRQLNGVSGDVDDACRPYARQDGSGTKVAPCGAVANSLFNDTYALADATSSGANVSITRTGIAWPTDRNVKFRNPSPATDTSLAGVFDAYAAPPFWQRGVDELDTATPGNNGFQNEAFIVWMRAAAFSNFRKRYGRLERSGEYAGGLLTGEYTLTVDYNYPVTAYGGRKRFVFSTDTWMGGKNSFLGVAYLVLAAVAFVLATCLQLIKHRQAQLSRARVSHAGSVVARRFS